MTRRAVAALGAIIATAVVVAILVMTVRNEPAPPERGAGNALQPLRDDLAWFYTTSGAVDQQVSSIPLVIAIVDREQVGDGTAWLLQSGVGMTWSTRLVLVQRGGEIWATAADELVDGAWKRSAFAAPQLYQPPPGEREWTVDYAGGPQAWRFSATWQQRRSGRITVVGQTSDAWLVEGDLDFDGQKSREVDTFVEGVGLASILSIGTDATPIRWDLAAFREDPGPVEGRYRIATDPALTLRISALTSLQVGDGPPQPVVDLHVDGSTVSFGGVDGSGAFTWAGRHTAAGLIGTAIRPGGSKAIMDFARIDDGRP